jgi:hypothetical protein
MYSEKLSEGLAVIGVIDPDAYCAGQYLSDEIDMSKFNRIIAIGMVGTMQACSTVTFTLQSASSSGGSYADITGKAATALTAAGCDDDKQVVLDLSAEELARLDADGRYVKLELDVGSAASDAGAIILGECARHKPASQDNLASVDEIV